MKFIIDRFEGDSAVAELQNGEMVAFTRKLLPPDVQEGSIVEIRCLAGETEKRRRSIKAKMDDIFKK